MEYKFKPHDRVKIIRLVMVSLKNLWVKLLRSVNKVTTVTILVIK